MEVSLQCCIFAIDKQLTTCTNPNISIETDMKILTLFVFSVLMSLTAFAQDEPKTITLTEAERVLVEQNSDFAFNLFRKTRGAENHVISPLSITYSLAMLNNGAEGVTREEIRQVLSGGRREGVPDVTTMNAFCRKMLTESSLLDENTRVKMANSIYVNGDRQDISLKSAFQNAASTYYDATPAVVSFSNDATLGIINQWATDQTDGMIHDLLKPEDLQDPNLVSVLLNAICFRGSWRNPFEEIFTRKEMFGNKDCTAMMMYQYNEFHYARTDLYESVILPYGNGSYQMTIILPCGEKTLDDVLASINGANWNAANYQKCSVVLTMPRIETDTNLDLVDVMASLGMENAFQKYNGHGFMDICYIGDNEENSDQCMISLMQQKAHLKLDEYGTEGAAVTAVSMTDGASPELVYFDAKKPFLYIVSERSTGTIFFIGQYMGEPIENPRHNIILTDEEKQIVERNNDFALNLFRKARGEKNCIMSPLSITYALGMVNNGAAGQTQQEINNVLGFGSAEQDVVNNFCKKILVEAPTLDKETSVEIANNIYLNSSSGYELQHSFVDIVNEFYGATPSALNFHDDATLDIINQWVNDYTHGAIPQIVEKDDFDADAVCYLFNALYFNGAWKEKFDKGETKDEAFNGGNVVPMMHRETIFDYTENELYQAVRLPYGNHAYEMSIILPREGKTISDVLAAMDGNNWQFRSGYDYMVDLKMPRFKTSSDFNLVQTMAELGMPIVFSPAAEFPYLGNAPVYIEKLFQKAIIDVNEDGTTAAAATGGSKPIGGFERVNFHANRPFFYIINEYSTGIIFFIGQYVSGTTTDIHPVECKMNKPAIYDLQGRKVLNGQLKKGLYIIDGKKVVIK